MPKAAARGFTMLELLVTLAIVGVLLLTVPAGMGALPGMRLHAAERRLADRLRMAREIAIETGAPQSVALDATSHPGGTTIRLNRAASDIRFFADGSSTGGLVVLSDGKRDYSIRIDSLTGRVAADE